jgi:hypothetical protein
MTENYIINITLKLLALWGSNNAKPHFTRITGGMYPLCLNEKFKIPDFGDAFGYNLHVVLL